MVVFFFSKSAEFFFAWDVLNIMRKVEYEKLNRNRIDFENGIWYIRVKIQKFNRERK